MIDEKSKARFWMYVRRGAGCWIWSGSTHSNGYGKLWVGPRSSRKIFSAHRLSWLICNGAIPRGSVVCHSCDNRLCVNPGHLWLGTQSDNIKDMHSKGRANEARRARGSRQGSAKLAEQDIPEIRKAISDGESLASIGRRYGVRGENISHIKHGRTWIHIK